MNPYRKRQKNRRHRDRRAFERLLSMPGVIYLNGEKMTWRQYLTAPRLVIETAAITFQQ